MGNRLPHLKSAAKSAREAVGDHQTAAAEKALEAGAALVEAKSLVGHGQWTAWLAEAGIPERSAQRYMALARGGLKSAIVADLGIAEAARLAGLGCRLWPGDGRVRHAEGVDEEHLAEAIWMRGDEGRVAYMARHVIGSEPAIHIRFPTVGMPWLLGLFHDGFPSAAGSVRCLSPSEAETVMSRIEAAI